MLKAEKDDSDCIYAPIAMTLKKDWFLWLPLKPSSLKNGSTIAENRGERDERVLRSVSGAELRFPSLHWLLPPSLDIGSHLRVSFLDRE